MVVVVFMLLLGAILFYRMVRKIQPDDHSPAENVTELLDVLESQIGEPMR